MEGQTQGSAEVQPSAPQPLVPHRGTVILILGIAGLVIDLFGPFCCGIPSIVGCICGIIAWVMANKDLKEMAAGAMDLSGRGMTQAGKVCGIISVILGIVMLLISLLILILIGFGHIVEQPRPM